MFPLTSIALISMRVSLNGIFSGNFSLVMATSKQSPKSMCVILPLMRSNMRFDGCLKTISRAHYYWPQQLSISRPDLKWCVWIQLTLTVLKFWKFTSYCTSYCSLKPLWSGMGEVVPARTLPTLHPPSPPTVHQLSWLALWVNKFHDMYYITKDEGIVPLTRVLFNGTWSQEGYSQTISYSFPEVVNHHIYQIRPCHN